MSELIRTDQDRKDWILKLQAFTAQLNNQVKKEDLRQHPFVKKAKYLPISFVEMKLDTLFFGLWETKNFKWEQIQNEIVASIEVSVFHPLERLWITRTGAMATQIMVDKAPDQMKGKERNLWALDPSNKKPNALEMGGFSALKAECFKNACLSIGKAFGRDINREDISEYHAWIKGGGSKKELESKKKELSELIDMVQDLDLKKSIIDKITTAESFGKNTVEFYQDQIDYLRSV